MYLLIVHLKMTEVKIKNYYISSKFQKLSGGFVFG